MANSLLTPTAVTREIQRVLHEKAQFISTINRSYDDSYAQTGAKIGDSLKIRLPNKYTVRTGKTLNAQDTSETSVTMTVATQKGVDMNFSTAELTMDLDDFSKRIIEPAVSVLISNIEYDALTSMTKKVYNQVGTAGTVPAAALVWNQARAKLNQYLAPKDNNRSVQCDSIAMSTTASAVGALFNPQQATGKMITEGYYGKLSGLNFYENERVYAHTVGGDVAGTINDASIADGDSTLTIANMSAAPAVGDVFTIANVYAVHPETKQAYSHLQQFVVTDTVTPTTTAISFSPAYYSSGANQNVNALPVTTAALTFTGTATTSYSQSLAYHRDAFAFATADLELPQGVHFAAREVMDGISVRLVRQYDINNDNIPCRLDILYGYKEIRPEMAVRVTS